MPNKPKPLVDEKPTVVQKRWWEIASDLITKADGLTKALATLLSAAILAWGLIASRSSPTPPAVPTTAQATTADQASALAPAAQSNAGSVEAPDEQKPPSPPPRVIGEVGWIYVGSRKDGQWWRDNREVAKTLATADVPLLGSAYVATGQIYLRKAPPTELPDGRRPPMEPIVVRDGEELVVQIGMRVKVDNVREVFVNEMPSVPRTWVWAHVTVLHP
ncbi:hypothetical protein LJR084_006133 [Variovorax sp. LjRoot84]|uniref:hypothetical protein n=1 Tax=Variovorax sp. LjRoot84 TaxID=3342340 RepID=UPI003ECE9549